MARRHERLSVARVAFVGLVASVACRLVVGIVCRRLSVVEVRFRDIAEFNVFFAVKGYLCFVFRCVYLRILLRGSRDACENHRHDYHRIGDSREDDTQNPVFFLFRSHSLSLLLCCGSVGLRFLCLLEAVVVSFGGFCGEHHLQVVARRHVEHFHDASVRHRLVGVERNHLG